jgi:hypothetical protein
MIEKRCYQIEIYGQTRVVYVMEKNAELACKQVKSSLGDRERIEHLKYLGKLCGDQDGELG